MDHNAIVDEILRRVAEKISEAEGCCAGKPGLLILTQDHGTDCHATLESEALKASYRTDCALMHHYEVDLDDYAAVVLFNLSCDAMAALASGACDTAYTRLASKAILSGKKVYVPTEEVELYQYKETAPAAYYNMMQQKLDLLVASGVVICARASLEQVILGSETPAPVPAAAPVSAAPACAAPLPNTLPDLIISPVESILSTSFCAVPAFIREEPVTTSAPTIGVMANSAVVETALPGLQEIPTVRQPSWRAYSSPAITYGVRPLAAMPTTTSCAVKLIFFRSLTPPSRLSSAPSTAC